MKNLLVFFLFFLSKIVSANNVIIGFKYLDKENIPRIKVYKNNFSFFEPDKHNDYTEIDLKKQNNVKLTVTTTQLLNIDINDQLSFNIAISPKDSVLIEIIKNKANSYPAYYLNFFGSNSSANNLYYHECYPIAKLFSEIDFIEKKVFNYKDFYLNTRKYIDSIENWFLSYTEYKKTEAIELYLLDIKASLFRYAIRRIGNVKLIDTSSKWSNYNEWSNYRNLFYYYGDAQNKNLLFCFTGKFLYNDFLSDIIRKDSIIYDTSLKKSDLGYFFLYPKNIAEDAWGVKLYSLLRLFPNHSFKDDIKLFSKYYSNSKYLPQINNFKDSILFQREKLIGEVNIVNADSKTFKDYFEEFNNRYFFIDCWATWCTPCIQEFNYYTDVSTFLFYQNIHQVFFSVDKLSDSTKVYNYLKEQKIKGTHTIINKGITEEIINELKKDKNSSIYDTEKSFSIPRYLLYDKLKRRLYTNLPKPSSGNLLKDAINNILVK